MKSFKKIIATGSLYISALLLVVNFPITVMAETATTTPTTTTPPVSQPETYTYNTSNGHWDTSKWYYDATTGTYQPVVQPQPTITTQPTVVSPAVTPTIVTPNTNTSTASGQQNSTTTALNGTNQAAVTNDVGSQATTGNATVVLNTNAASATSGDATATATILNNVNSSISTANNQAAASFVTNVMGDVNGDIMLQPMLLKSMLESGSNNPTSATANITNTNNLTNNINLGATSGNAGVVGNTSAGNATSGTANTVANVVNIINSLVASNQSFVGTVNIYGNLNGDILIAPDFIPQLIASNGGNAMVDTNKNSDPTTSKISSNDMQSIVNNVSLAAQTGKAAVMDNTSAGNATSGSANTNVVIFNLSGHDIIASNSLLVFVNVLGKWVGVIVDAPVGATAAAIGNGVKTDTVVPPNLTIVNNNTNQITNNIKLSSLSGNATVAANTLAGNAVTGNATSSANIANMSNSQFGLTGWFGVLFINVFGNWYGSFGINTAYGDPINGQSSNKSTTRVIEFIPKTTKQSLSNFTLISKNNNSSYSATDQSSQTNNGKVLGVVANDPAKPNVYSVNPSYSKGLNMALIAGSAFLVAISAAGIRRFVFLGKPESVV